MRPFAFLVLLFALAVMPACRRSSGSDAVQIKAVVEGLEHPWGLAFLPDGRMLITERRGRLRIVSADGALSPPVAGVAARLCRRTRGIPAGRRSYPGLSRPHSEQVGWL